MIKNIEFDPDKKQLDLYVDFKEAAPSGLMNPVMMARVKFTTPWIKGESVSGESVAP